MSAAQLRFAIAVMIAHAATMAYLMIALVMPPDAGIAQAAAGGVAVIANFAFWAMTIEAFYDGLERTDTCHS